MCLSRSVLFLNDVIAEHGDLGSRVHVDCASANLTLEQTYRVPYSHISKRPVGNS
jgi:hypothetical protein